MKVALGVIGIAAACTIGAVSSASAGDDPVAGKSVAPAGKNGRIVFRFHNGTDFDLYTMLGDGSQMTNLTPGAATDDRDPEFSPNAQKIVFRRVGPPPDFNRDVWIMNP